MFINSYVKRARCTCGRVAFVAEGHPIASAVCYCQSCQDGGAQVAALPGARTVVDDDGGTAYLVYRDDRFRCLFGREHLANYKLSEKSRTTRIVASCCNTPMYLKFGPGHWTSAYRARFEGRLPPIEMRTHTKTRTASQPIPLDAPSHRGFPISLMARLVSSRMAMLVGR